MTCKVLLISEGDMEQKEYLQNYSLNDIRLGLVEKLDEVRRVIISGDKDMIVQVLVELEIHQKTFDSLYDKYL
ncbi:hypothetical protein [Photobacterium leiognathi]|uniref:hypothetical protein n=1 Tax=Photobacterium leiognathi TaxID=553611 RepID=UPI0027398651|nr:hypothetical protein [Photobacterium leiognathi]